MSDQNPLNPFRSLTSLFIKKTQANEALRLTTAAEVRRIKEAYSNNIYNQNVFTGSMDPSVSANKDTQFSGSAGYYSPHIPDIPVTYASYVPPNIIDQYPITNPAYARIANASTFTQLIYNFPECTVEQGKILEMWDNLSPHKNPVIGGILRHVRYHAEQNMLAPLDLVVNGHAYDPWFRQIARGPNFISLFEKRFETVNGHEGNSNWLLVYAIRTTLSGEPVHLVIVDSIAMDYINKIKTDRHFAEISPFGVRTSTDYDLRVKRV